MRILVTGFTDNYGGVETFIYNHYLAIKRSDPSFIIDILSTSKQPAFMQEFKAMEGIIYTVARSRNRLKQNRDLKKLFLNNDGISYDAIWCNKCDLIDINFIHKAYKYKIPIRIIHSHNSFNINVGLKRIITFPFHYINKLKMSTYATNFWACSDNAAKWLFTKKILHKYQFIPNAISIEKFNFSNVMRDKIRNQQNIQDNLVIGVVGRFSYQKNPELILDIFKSIHDKKSNTILLWVGTGELMDKIKKQIKIYSLESSVILLGVRHDVDVLMQAMDCLLLPSRFEGLPIVAIEAQACGLHVFAAKEMITNQTKISNSLTFISINKKPQEWANIIISTNIQHKNNLNDVIKSGFELANNANMIYHLFNNML